MKKISLALHVRKLALSWTIGAMVLTVTLCGSLSFFLMYKDVENTLLSTVTAAVSSYRTELLSGDVRSIELQLRRDSVDKNEQLLFLDQQQHPWVETLDNPAITICSLKPICRDYLHAKLIVDEPIYFDRENKALWGYLHIEKDVRPNWSLIGSVALAIVLGMLIQSLGFYFNLMKAISSVSFTIFNWAKRLSDNPKDAANYRAAPYSEMDAIEKALNNLKLEIDSLEATARNQGALTTLRGIGHDILNPVARMKRLVGLLKMQKDVPYDGEIIGGLDSNLKRLSSYAEQLKILHKKLSGEAASEQTAALNIAAEITSLARDLSSEAEFNEKHLTLQTDISEDHILVPPPAFGRIFENLIHNSIHASNDGGTIFIASSSDEKCVTITVEDQGEGIPDKNLSKIFEPNFTTRTNKGTGLGLFVVKQICEQYGGGISVSSKESVGTRFQIIFPKAEVGI